MANLRDLGVSKATRQEYFSCDKILHDVTPYAQLELRSKAPKLCKPMCVEAMIELCDKSPEAALKFHPEFCYETGRLTEYAVQEPGIAIQYATEYLDPSFVRDLAPDAPVQAIKYASDVLSQAQLDEYALLYPRATIKSDAINKVSEHVFDQVVHREPELAWKYLQDRLPKGFSTRILKGTMHGQKKEFILQNLMK